MSQNYGCSPITIEFLDNITGNTDSIIWDFGDGSPIQIYSQFNDTIFHAFTYYGTSDTTYTITLIGVNGCGTDTAQQSVTVYPNTVNAFFNVDTLAGCAPLSVSFIDYSTGNDSCTWDFGDGNYSTSCNVSPHTYTLPGIS